jgi:hypothetical protein
MIPLKISNLKTQIKNKIWANIKDYFYFQRMSSSPIVQNINLNCDPDQKKVIICYLTNGYFINFGNSKKTRTQLFEIMQIVNVFSSIGYAIDIIRFNDINALEVVKNKKYDSIFGFGEAFYQFTNLQPEAVSILYMTENPPEFSCSEEQKRLDYFYERYGRRYKFKRSGYFYKIHHLQKTYSYVITMGETKLLDNQYRNPYFIFPTGLRNLNYIFINKNHLQTRKHFLWFGSGGAVHKGLDLLLDVFNQQDNIVLHFCGLYKEEREHLSVPRRENIIEYGHIDIESDFFLELVNKCSYIILPSCSEGCSTSITTGMLHGLIPIVIRDTGFNRLGNNAIFLEDFKIDYLRIKLNEISNLEPERLSLLSKKIFDFAQQNFLISVFKENFRKIILEITGKIG